MENHTNKTYQERMNKTASSKFGAIKKHLEKGVKLLDFGSGFSPEFIEQVQQTGAHYVAYDVSNIVQNQLKENDIDFLTKEELTNTEDEFDVIYLSSVFHELMSYLSRPERRETFAMLDKALKPDGVIVIRDWGYEPNPNDITSFEVASSTVNEEVYIWIKELIKNSIIENLRVVDHIENDELEPDIYVTTKQNIYEIMLHTVWGLNSLEREAQETYSVTPELIEKWICRPYGYRNAKFELNQEEYDETYLPYLQKYFKIDELPWPTKIIYELRKTK
jgi:SAM-dependent methyltransferase